MRVGCYYYLTRRKGGGQFARCGFQAGNAGRWAVAAPSPGRNSDGNQRAKTPPMARSQRRGDDLAAASLSQAKSLGSVRRSSGSLTGPTRFTDTAIPHAFQGTHETHETQACHAGRQTLSANSPPGGQGVFIGVLYPLRQIDRPKRSTLASSHRALAQSRQADSPCRPDFPHRLQLDCAKNNPTACCSAENGPPGLSGGGTISWSSGSEMLPRKLKSPL